ncbi:hypothetical protein HRG_001583 [Hirsutella rhossiliensis]|uniref:Uncharacterized protein n=1 Tax=Hirsutella rhossiliensis TaxID=111463 RepID=A0A9P8N3J5_9HYPO|nr:uncharacterized protein HRG_01583 [Hirsutella rhossiliensis]KAH0966174.1 hypothetical protein HRG_01583 [Hirsutella rhossiliensis]
MKASCSVALLAALAGSAIAVPAELSALNRRTVAVLEAGSADNLTQINAKNHASMATKMRMNQAQNEEVKKGIVFETKSTVASLKRLASNRLRERLGHSKVQCAAEVIYCQIVWHRVSFYVNQIQRAAEVIFCQTIWHRVSFYVNQIRCAAEVIFCQTIWHRVSFYVNQIRCAAEVIFCQTIWHRVSFYVNQIQRAAEVIFCQTIWHRVSFYVNQIRCAAEVIFCQTIWHRVSFYVK